VAYKEKHHRDLIKRINGVFWSVYLLFSVLQQVIIR